MMADIAREHPLPTSDQLRETEIIRELKILQREHLEACRPYIEELALIRACRPLTLILTPEQVEHAKDRLKNVDLA